MKHHRRAGTRWFEAGACAIPFGFLEIGEDVDFKPCRDARLQYGTSVLESGGWFAGRFGVHDPVERGFDLRFVRLQTSRQDDSWIVHQRHDCGGVFAGQIGDESTGGFDGGAELRLVAGRQTAH